MRAIWATLAAAIVFFSTPAAAGLWLGQQTFGGDALLNRYNPTTGLYEDGVALTTTFGGAPADPLKASAYNGFAFAPDGSLWLAQQTFGGDALLNRYNPTTGLYEGGIALTTTFGGAPADPLKASAYNGFAFAPDGSLWLGQQTFGGDALLNRYNPTTGLYEGGIALTTTFGGAPADPLKASAYSGFAFAPDGSLWLGQQTFGGDALLNRYNLTTGLYEDGIALTTTFGGAPADPLKASAYNGFAFAPSFNPAAPVPEPSVWLIMIAGFGLAGTALRARRTGVAHA
ncbi:hypothetical protein DJ019_04450 [Phenylobacterium kunshanense]|uniref:Ice-binding protein C-terminal domain-containing protein n=2 Tax=Phenylobacterium kunshanense TaxID=1445034 RepID=A0A328BJ53_9CAUL|nr:hypothetical protein DJ019_04450 [Phenylobacterium kunshanense]